jgi:2-polyprenyl-6-methoxyphenol hydroxylase-like FAD-dependent oxidoreductase
VFLVGDCAHQFYPTEVTVNTGTADAVDLGGAGGPSQRRGGPTLLTSYEAERRPVAMSWRCAPTS